MLQFNLLTAQLHENIRFRNLTTDDGLSGNSAFCIAPDQHGHMWIGTYGDGVNLYDGYVFRYFRHSPFDNNSIADNVVSTVAVDRKNRIWIGHPHNGISVYDQSSATFKKYTVDTLKKNALPSLSIRHIICDRAGNIWIACAAGLLRYDETTDGFEKYYMQGEEPSNLFEVFEDNKGRIWVGIHWVPYGGVYVLDPKTKKFTWHSPSGSNGNPMSDQSSVIVGQDADGMIWTGSRNGINVLDPSTGGFEQHRSDPANRATLSGNDFLQGKIMRDSKGNLWIGSYKEGLSIYDYVTKKFIRVVNDADDPYSISSNNVRDICEDPSGLVWVVTNGGGISIYDPYFNQFRIYRHLPGFVNSPAGGIIGSSCYDEKNDCAWFSYTAGGFDRWNAVSGEFTHYDENIFTRVGRKTAFIQDIFPETDGTVLLAFFGGGVMKFDPVKRTLTPMSIGQMWVNRVIRLRNGNYLVGTNELGLDEFSADQKFIRKYLFKNANNKSDSCFTGSVISKLFEDSRGDWWVKTQFGLNRFDCKTKRFEFYEHDATDSTSISGKDIRSIWEDSQGRILLGSAFGVDCFDPTKKLFTHITAKHGLPSEQVNDVIDDGKNNLWIATSMGLCGISGTGTTKIFDRNDGLPDNNIVSVTKMKSGRLLCTFDDGFFVLDPDLVLINNHAPQVMITSMTLKNNPYKNGSELSDSTTIELDYSHGFFTFVVTAIDYVSPAKNEYAYWLEGFNDDWVMMGARREITFTNLDPGEYILHVKAANSHGKWNEDGDSIRITITPPWWETKSFTISSVLFLIVVLFGTVKWRERKLRKDKAILEQEVAHRTKEVHEQKFIIEEKSKEITDSIIYAKRIQGALLSSESGLKKYFADYFILYKPKDIVSGDFYWTYNDENKIIVCTGDCTGHGVPGAFMSLLNISLLKETVGECPDIAPHELLNKVRTGITTSLNPEGSTEESKDGMDCVVYSFDPSKRMLQFACANNPLWIWRNGSLLEFKPDKMPVGRHFNDDVSFSLRTEQLEKDDIVFTLTDGYADQFGGERGKKFKYSNLKKLLCELSASETSLPAIRNKLLAHYDEWKGSLEQIDDVCIIGVKI